MKLVSCDGCGVILDQDKLKFADDIYLDDSSIDLRLAQYNNSTNDFDAYVPCPVCKAEVFKT